MAWTDEGKQRFEFEWAVGNSEDGERCVRPMTASNGIDHVWVVMTREALTEFIQMAQNLLDENPA